jgi:uncharacterized protein YggE
MIFRMLTPVIGLCLLMGNAIAQVQPTTIEVESQGTITFSPDSFVVKLRFDRSSVNAVNREIETFSSEEVLMPVEVMESVEEFSPAADVEPPPTMAMEEVKSPEQMRKERERYRLIEDSIQKIRTLRALEFEAKLLSMGVRIPKTNPMEEGYHYRSNTWVQVLTSAQYGKIDSLSKMYGRPLNLEMVDIKMKDHAVLKERAYRQAIENSKLEAESLAKAMGRKVGKMTSVKTESIDLMDIVPLMLRKEIQREVRKSDRFLQPALYQLSQELGNNFFEKDRSDEKNIAFWTWSEKIKVTYLLN